MQITRKREKTAAGNRRPGEEEARVVRIVRSALGRSARHRNDAEDLAGRGDGNMRTAIDRASDRPSDTPAHYK
jgi:hypothetical protein